MEYIIGDILEVKRDKNFATIIIQQVNCSRVMEAGLAKDIKNKYPFVYSHYISHIDEYKTKGYELLGSINKTNLPNGVVLVNFFSQYGYGGYIKNTDYNAFEKCLSRLSKICENSKIPVGYRKIYFPYKIGCGLGGGKWDVIKGLIEKYFEDAIIVTKE